MRHWLLLFLSLLFLVCAPATLAEQSQPEAEIELRAVLDRFFAAYSRADLSAALAETTDTPAERDWMRDYLQKEFASGSRYTFQIDRFRVRRLDAPFAITRARIVWKWVPTGSSETQESLQSWDFSLIWEAGKWRLRGFRFAESYLLRLFKEAEDSTQRAALLQKDADIVGGWLALTLRQQGDQLSQEGKTEEAERISTIAFEVAEWMNDDYERAYCYLSRGAVRRRAQQWNPALKDWNQARSLFEKTNDKEGLAKAWRNSASLYQQVAEFDRAVRAYEQALVYWREIKEERAEAEALQDLGTVHQDAGRPTAALERYEQALQLQIRLKNLKSQAQLLGNIAAIKQDQERYAEALELYDRAGAIYAKIQDRSGESVFLTNLANLYDLLGQPEEAERQHRQAVKSAEGSPLRVNLMIALHNLCNFLTRQGRSGEAIEAGLASMKIAHEIGDTRYEANSLNTVGELLFRDREWEKAIIIYKDALEVSQETGNRVQEAVATVGLAGCYAQLRQVGLALHYFEEARRLAELTGNLLLLHTGARLQADFYRRSGDLPKAVQYYRRAIAYVEQVRAQAGVRSLQSSFLREYSFLYHRLAECLLKLGDARGVFAVSEQLRARTLVDVIRSGNYRVIKAMTPEESNTEARLESQLQGLSQALEKAVRTEDAERLKEQQAELRAELKQFQDLLYARHPQLRTQRANFEPATPEELAQRLLSRAPRAAVLSYLVMADQTLLFVLRREASGKPRLTMHQLPLRSNDLLRRVEEFWQACSTPGGAYEAEGKRIYRDLISPALPDLAGIDHLVFVPGADLGILPFSALPDDAGTPLVARYALSYAPSVTALMHQVSQERKAPDTQQSLPFLAFGNPLFPANLSELPATEGEVTAISRLFGPAAQVFLRKEALESRAKELLGRARIVHFATHGTLDERAPMYSSVVLTRDDRNDGFLQARELSELELHSELVVLSACETALGQKVRGEGVVGLAWALFVGGAQSTVASQWQVPDESTRHLMVQFYRRLLTAGTNRASALRDAQLSLVRDKRYAHPYHWAPFTLSGQWLSHASNRLQARAH